MSALVDKTTFYLTGGGSTVECQYIEDFSADPEHSGTVHKGPAGVIGSTKEEGGWTMQVKVRRPRAKRADVDWNHVWEHDLTFRFEVQEVGGDREVYYDCRIVHINSKSSSGDRSKDISILAIKRTVDTF